MTNRKFPLAALLIASALSLAACNNSNDNTVDNAKPADSGQGLQQSDVGSGDGPTMGAGSSNARQNADPGAN